MNIIKCYDVASMVISEASDQFGVMWKVDRGLERVFEIACNTIDALSEEFNGVSIEVTVDEITMEITVSLVCEEIVVENNTHKIYSVLRRAKRFSIKNAEERDNIQIDFVFPGIWKMS